MQFGGGSFFYKFFVVFSMEKFTDKGIQVDNMYLFFVIPNSVGS